MLVQDCLSAMKDRESGFHLCGGLVKLVKFLHCGSHVMLMPAFLCARYDRETRFYHSGCLVKLV